MNQILNLSVMENTKVLLEQLYKEYAPEKAKQIDALLEKHQGKEKQFYVSEKAKYSKKRSITDSKKILEEAMARIAAQKKEEKSKPKAKVKKPESKPLAKKAEPKAENPKTENITKGTVKTEEKSVENKSTIDKEIPKKDTKEHLEKKETVVVLTQNETKPETIKEKLEPKKEDVPKKTDKKEINKLEEAKARLAASKKQTARPKKKPVLWMIILLILVLLLIFLSVYYSNYYNPHEGPSTNNVAKVEETKTDMGRSDIEENTHKDAINEQTDTIAETNHPEETEEAPEEELIPANADRLYVDDIPEKAIFVSCFSVKQEEAAQEKMKQLKKFKLKVHYYWIPDIDPKGNTYFKVVVGPFKDIASAYPSLTKVQERINFDAYILTVK